MQLNSIVTRVLTRSRPITHIEALKNYILLAQSDRGGLRILDIGAGQAQYWTSGALFDLISNGIVTEVTLLDAANESVFEDLPTSGPSFRRIEGSAPDFLNGFDSKSFDLVVAFDLIEHLSEAEGYLMLYQMERISRRFVGLYTPNGFVWQPPSPDNPFNAHVSGWTLKKLKQMGFTEFFGHAGWKSWIGPYAEPKFGIFNSSVLSGINLLSANFPSMCFAVSAWKKVEEDYRVSNQFVTAG